MSVLQPFSQADDIEPQSRSSQRANVTTRSWPDYRTVWRWHFYAGLLCVPIVIVLSISGATYLFKTEIEAWQERNYDNLPIGMSRPSAARQIQAALAEFPGTKFNSYEIPQSATSAGRVLLSRSGETLRVYVHPETQEVLGSINDSEKLMKRIFRLHGELWMGNRGSNLVELAASWTIILILTGLVLWWPRNARGLGGILYPRLHKGQRILWRDLHSVTGIWVSFLVLFLLVSGLPWAKFWGDYFKAIRRFTGTAVARQEWSNGSERPASGASKSGGAAGEHSEHGGARGRSKDAGDPIDFTDIDRIVAAVVPLNLPHPVVVSPPGKGSTEWSVKSMTPNRPQRVNLTVDRDGQILSRDGFADRHWIDKLVSIGIAAHEGRLFGWPNQLLGLIAALGLIVISMSGVIMWLKRRDHGVLGAPEPRAASRWPIALFVVVAFLGFCLPLFGLSLLLVLGLEWTVLRRIPPVRAFLGLTSALQLVSKERPVMVSEAS